MSAPPQSLSAPAPAPSHGPRRGSRHAPKEEVGGVPSWWGGAAASSLDLGTQPAQSTATRATGEKPLGWGCGSDPLNSSAPSLDSALRTDHGG